MSKEKDKITVFVERLQKIGVEVMLGGNYPWVYIDYINGKRVTEKFKADHGFTLALVCQINSLFNVLAH